MITRMIRFSNRHSRHRRSRSSNIYGSPIDWQRIKTAPVPVSHIGILTGCCSLSAIPVQCTARHCTRKRKVGDVDSIPNREEILAGIDYIRNTPQIRDVLLSGGDPFMLSDEYLDWILTELRSIPHVEVIRMGHGCPSRFLSG